jgi:hypothetical protein
VSPAATTVQALFSEKNGDEMEPELLSSPDGEI